MLLTIMIYVLGAIAIYFLLLKLTNHSPTTDSVMLVMLGIIGGLVIKSSGDISVLKYEVKGIKKIQNLMGSNLKELIKIVHNQEFTLKEHGSTLNEHSSILKEHSSILNEHSSILKEHSHILNEHSFMLKEHGTLLRDIAKRI